MIDLKTASQFTAASRVIAARRSSIRVLKFIVILWVTFLAEQGSADLIRVLTLDETRIGVITHVNGSINFNFRTGGGFSLVRAALLSPSRFGPAGVVNRGVELVASVGTITENALTGADVFVLPWDAAMTSAELDALTVFVNQGGGLLSFANDSPGVFAVVFGATSGTATGGTSFVSAAVSSVTNGPFGTLLSGTPIPAGFTRSFGSLGANGTEITRFSTGESTAALFNLGSGRAAIFGDEELFLNSISSVPGIASGKLTDPSDNLTLFLNAFVAVTPDDSFQFVAGASAVPEPRTAGILGLIACGITVLRRRRKHSHGMNR